MGTFVEGVDFDTIAREWRCKWSAEGDKKSLADAQKALNEILPAIKSIDGVKSVHRVVCGGNLDFKVSCVGGGLGQTIVNEKRENSKQCSSLKSPIVFFLEPGNYGSSCWRSIQCLEGKWVRTRSGIFGQA
jgi:hypothetical protein